MDNKKRKILKNSNVKIEENEVIQRLLGSVSKKLIVLTKRWSNKWVIMKRIRVIFELKTLWIRP